ncbi:MAG: hypothetical protein NWF00_06295 [Candidatus Bathyarchaeota archaeon]|nr:hypothetical protein [Candidatus Bathyarchaeota archaeon]
MEIQEEDVRTLTSLDLTYRQARVYLALAMTGRTTIKNVSKVSKVSRHDTYRIIAILQKLGLVERGLTSPATFKAVSLKEGLAILLQRQKKELSRTQLKVEKLFERFKEQNINMFCSEEEPQFTLISGRERIESVLRGDIITTQSSIDLSGTWELFREYIFEFSENFRDAGKKRLCFKALINKPKTNSAFLEITQFLKKNPACHVKYTQKATPISMLNTDKSTVNLFTTEATTFFVKNLTIMRTTNASVEKLVCYYFENMWTQAEEYLPKAYYFA